MGGLGTRRRKKMALSAQDPRMSVCSDGSRGTSHPHWARWSPRGDGGRGGPHSPARRTDHHENSAPTDPARNAPINMATQKPRSVPRSCCSAPCIGTGCPDVAIPQECAALAAKFRGRCEVTLCWGQSWVKLRGVGWRVGQGGFEAEQGVRVPLFPSRVASETPLHRLVTPEVSRSAQKLRMARIS